HCHVSQSLQNKAETKPRCQQCAESFGTEGDNPYTSEHQDHIEAHQYYTAYGTVFFDDDSEDKIGIRVRQYVTLCTVARAFPKQSSGCDGNLRMVRLV